MNTEIDKEIPSGKEIENNISFLDSAIDKATSIILHFDNQSNILIGISVAISAFAVTHIDEQKLAFSVLALFSSVATVFGLYAIHPPRYLRKKGQDESLLYNKKIISFKKSEDYTQSILEIIDSKDKLIEQYTKEIYNIYKYHYRPKRELFKWARNILVSGIVISVILYILNIF